MSRSRRKTPIVGMTHASSENQDKRIYNRAFRRVTRQLLKDYDDDHKPLPILKEHSDPWLMAKDGRQRLDPLKHPKCMRK